MARRLMVTGYLLVEDLEDDGYLDENDKSGLTERGYDEVMNYTLSDLQDVVTRIVD